MDYKELVKHFGTASGAARAIGYAKQTVSYWKTAGIPFEAQFRIQMKTKGRLRMDMPPEKHARQRSK